MSKRRTHTERRKTEIALRATSHFLRYGFTDTNLDQIVQDCGCSKATLYTYFGSKEGLFEAVVGLATAAEGAFSVDQDLPMEEALKAFLGRALELMTAPQTIALARLVISEASRSPAMARSFERATHGRYLSTLTDYLDARQKAGDIAPCDPDLAARELSGLLMQTTPILLLLGAIGQLSPREIRRRAATAVTHFLKLYR